MNNFNSKLIGVKGEETIEHEYKVDSETLENSEVTVPDTTPILTSNVETKAKKYTLTTKESVSLVTATTILRSTTPTTKTTSTPTTTTTTTSTTTTTTTSVTTSTTTLTLKTYSNDRKTSPFATDDDYDGDYDEDFSKSSTLSVPTVSTDTDINYILNILDITNVSKEYKSRKDIQSNNQDLKI